MNHKFLYTILKDIALRSYDINPLRLSDFEPFTYFGFDSLDRRNEMIGSVYLFATPLSNDVIYENNNYQVQEITFQLSVGSQVRLDDKNTVDSISDTNEILKGIIAELSSNPWYRKNKIRLINTITIESLFRMDDANNNIAQANLTIRFPFKYNLCNIPIDLTIEDFYSNVCDCVPNSGGGGKIVDIFGCDNITIDKTDPKNPVICADLSDIYEEINTITTSITNIENNEIWERFGDDDSSIQLKGTTNYGVWSNSFFVGGGNIVDEIFPDSNNNNKIIGNNNSFTASYASINNTNVLGDNNLFTVAVLELNNNKIIGNNNSFSASSVIIRNTKLLGDYNEISSGSIDIDKYILFGDNNELIDNIFIRKSVAIGYENELKYQYDSAIIGSNNNLRNLYRGYVFGYNNTGYINYGAIIGLDNNIKYLNYGSVIGNNNKVSDDINYGVIIGLDNNIEEDLNYGGIIGNNNNFIDFNNSFSIGNSNKSFESDDYYTDTSYVINIGLWNEYHKADETNTIGKNNKLLNIRSSGVFGNYNTIGLTSSYFSDAYQTNIIGYYNNIKRSLNSIIIGSLNNKGDYAFDYSTLIGTYNEINSSIIHSNIFGYNNKINNYIDRSNIIGGYNNINSEYDYSALLGTFNTINKNIYRGVILGNSNDISGLNTENNLSILGNYITINVDGDSSNTLALGHSQNITNLNTLTLGQNIVTSNDREHTEGYDINFQISDLFLKSVTATSSVVTIEDIKFLNSSLNNINIDVIVNDEDKNIRNYSIELLLYVDNDGVITIKDINIDSTYSDDELLNIELDIDLDSTEKKLQINQKGLSEIELNWKYFIKNKIYKNI